MNAYGSLSPRIEKGVAIAGGGATGLFLALALARREIRSHVFERHRGARTSSRSIGIHPPSLEALAELGLERAFVARGVHVERGEARSKARLLGEIDFRACAPPYRYVLTLPQDETEAILREAAEKSPFITLARANVISAVPLFDRASISISRDDVHVERIDFEAVVGCDGKRSSVRKALGIDFDGATYPGQYFMADFPDRTTLGSTAVVFLGDGLVESFPLPDGLRRWVARCRAGAAGSVRELVGCVRSRTGFVLDEEAACHASGFRAERFIARHFTRGRIALAGDAAHVVSPIGGQGMNLGWLGARSLAAALADSLSKHRCVALSLALDGARRRSIASVAARRAELNMWVGRPTTDGSLRDSLVEAVLGTPVQRVIARVFTMRGLGLRLV